MQATVVAPQLSTVPIRRGRRVLAAGVYRPSERPKPAVVTCVWCGKPITPSQRRQTIGFGVLHNEPETPCVSEFDELTYGPGRAR